MATCGIYAYYIDRGQGFEEKNIIYIGQSIHIETRLKQHEAWKNKFLNFVKGGVSKIDTLFSMCGEKYSKPIKSIILTVCEKESLTERENFYIEKYKDIILNTGWGTSLKLSPKKAEHRCLEIALELTNEDLKDYWGKANKRVY